MSRVDYNEIKTKFADYIRVWKSYDLKEIDRIFHPDVYFKTSTSIRMANGNQDSIFGVYDFINDFPKTDELKSQIYNYVCRIKKDLAMLKLCVQHSMEQKLLSFWNIQCLLQLNGTKLMANGKS